MRIELINQEIIKNKKGNIKKFLNKKDSIFRGFGECYFSEIKSKNFKGLKKNLTTFQMLTVISGNVKFFLIDDRIKKKLTKKEFILDDNKNFKKLIIPKNVWYGFKNLSKKTSIIFNFLNYEHKKTKIITKEII